MHLGAPSMPTTLIEICFSLHPHLNKLIYIIWFPYDLIMVGLESPDPPPHTQVFSSSHFLTLASLLITTLQIYTYNVSTSLIVRSIRNTKKFSARKLAPAMAGILFRLLVNFLLLSGLVYWSDSFPIKSMSS